MSITEQAGSMTDASGSVGAQLAQGRMARGLSVEDVYRRTNIRPGVVRALESDDLEPSGGAVYARGHVRSIAQALGLDTGPLMAAFDAAHGTDSPPPPLLNPDTDAPDVSLRPSSAPTSGPRWPLIMAGLLVVVIAVALVQLLLPGSDGEKHVSAAKPSASSQPTHPATKPSKAPLTTALLDIPVPPEGVTLRLVLPFKPSWVDVKDERGNVLLQRTVTPSYQPIDLHATGPLQVTIGDASAAALSCNGHHMVTLGAQGQVVSFTFARGTEQCPG